MSIALDRLPVPVLVFDAEGHCVGRNAPARALLGEDDWDARVEAGGADLLRRLLNLPQAGLGRLTVVPPRGAPVHLRADIGAADDAGRSVVLTSLDAPTDHAVHGRLQQAQRLEAVGGLADGLAHAINNVLAVVLGIASVLRDEVPADAPWQEDLADILSAAGRGRDLTRNLLGFTRRATSLKEATALRPLIEEVAELVGRTRARHVRLVIDCADAIEVEADRGQLSHALMNLLLNAADASKDGLEVRVAADVATQAPPPGITAGDFVALSVTDHGAGMDSPTLRRAFEPFFTTKTIEEGRGLGLTVVDRIVGAHGGWVDARSQPGDGTTITLYLPASGPLTRQSSGPLPTLDEASVMLVVDDDPVVRRAGTRLLQSLGFTVEDASTGEEALARLADAAAPPVGLVLLDVLMPGIDGFEVHRRLRADHPLLPIVLTSGYVPASAGEMPRDARTAFLPKPFSATELARQVRLLLPTAE